MPFLIYLNIRKIKWPLVEVYRCTRLIILVTVQSVILTGEKIFLNMEVKSVSEKWMWNKNKRKIIYKNKTLSTEFFHTYYPKPQERENKINFLTGKQVEIWQESGTLSLQLAKTLSLQKIQAGKRGEMKGP